MATFAKMRIPLFSWFSFMSLLFILGRNCNVAAFGRCLDDQKLLLLKLKNELKFNSANSAKLSRWDDSLDCCSWDGVKCDTNGHVISLDLHNETISGGLSNSSSLFSLDYLTSLNLAHNLFYPTPFPSGFHKFTNLSNLNLSWAGFVGQIPVDFARLTGLVTLDLSTAMYYDQRLEMENPSLGTLVQNLKELQYLNLDGVDISSSGKDWSSALASLSNLQVLSLRDSRLSGPIHSSLSELHSLSVIRLDLNDLSAIVPDFFANLTKLTVLTLVACNLVGHFPPEIFQVPTLQILDLTDNGLLSGSLPQFPPNGSFRTITLTGTNFSGLLPYSIGNLQHLSTLDLSSCRFTGPIPSTIANLQELVYVDLSNNMFQGPIPLLQMSKHLNHVDLSHNNFSGQIPSSYFNGLHELNFLDLSYNSFNGSIPLSLFSLDSIQSLRLSNNQFSGPLTEFQNASAPLLESIDMTSNQLTGMIPEFLFQLQSLSSLRLSFNQFNRFPNLSIDARISNSTLVSPFLTFLTLASCNLQNFPDLRNLSSLMYIDLSDNRITGKIPNWIWTFDTEYLMYLNLSYNLLDELERPYSIPDSLQLIDLHSNRLRGQFPRPPVSAVYVDYSNNNFDSFISPDIGELIRRSKFLSLSNNSLQGVIPVSICNGTYLQVLDLSSNMLTGNIPECIFDNIENLTVLNLGRNNFSGIIADKFPTNCSLRTIDLSRNALNGKLPRTLVNCVQLDNLNIGGNRIEDTFPCTLQQLSSLRILVLRSNLFHGDIHCLGANSSWPNLQVADLSSNTFSSDLSPINFANWKAMMVEDGNGKLEQNAMMLESGNGTPIVYLFLPPGGIYYQDSMMVTIKGLELELKKILTIFKYIDFSSNNFEGRIPEVLGDLKGLYLLNLSHNNLIGTIPKTFGNLKLLGSLDLSRNQLGGTIPMELANLTFLSFLNLSFNKLFGRIPTGNQFQTFSETSFQGNAGLCGFPLNNSCDGNAPRPNLSSDYPDDTDFNWPFIFAALGYSVGLGSSLLYLMAFSAGRNLRDKLAQRVLSFFNPAYIVPHTRYIIPAGGRVYLR